MKAGATTLSRVVALLTMALVGIGCEEDQLAQLRPIISVCDAEQFQRCDRRMDLGEIFSDLEQRFVLFVFNLGDGPLVVSSMGTNEDWATLPDESITVEPGAFSAVELVITPPELGPGEVLLRFETNDPQRPIVEIAVGYDAAQKPTPGVTLCLAGTPRERCDVDQHVDIGVVRRTQAKTIQLWVRNRGSAELDITDVNVNTENSVPGEMVVVTSVRPGALAAGQSAVIELRYAPVDATNDSLEMIFATNDPIHPTVSAVFTGRSQVNLPPIAVAHEHFTELTILEVEVGDLVVLEGGDSIDPEGDPLLFHWTLTQPAASTSALDDPSAGRPTFVPDLAGSFRADLLVEDSLGQFSPAESVTIIALPEAALRVRLSWETGGDLDLHLVPTGDALFSATDCYFENPRPDYDAPGPLDDPELLGDAQASPGLENLVFKEPASGTYGIYVQYYEEGGLGAATARAVVTLFDSSVPDFDGTTTISATCELWHLGDITFPDGMFTPSTGGLTSVCP